MLTGPKASSSVTVILKSWFSGSWNTIPTFFCQFRDAGTPCIDTADYRVSAEFTPHGMGNNTVQGKAKGGFSGARGSHDGNKFPLFDPQLQPLKDIFALRPRYIA
jgi:hypothetical protein